jgi:cell division cycle 14
MGLTPEEAFAPFASVSPPYPPFHDASPCACTYNLTIMDCLRGMYKAKNLNFFSFDGFNIEEYEKYEKVEEGDFNWLVYGKFLAFAGPHNTRDSTSYGYTTLVPEDYVPYFKKNNVQHVIRLNKKYYDASRFTNQGIGHTEIYFLDGSTPSDHLLQKFIKVCESVPGAVAVHCKAGLGRTGTCIGAYLMKHFRMTAAEVIGWFRICRPGSIIGPQQQYMEEIQARMWREGDIYRERMSAVSSTSKFRSDELTVKTAPVSAGPEEDFSEGITGQGESLRMSKANSPYARR